MNREEKSALVDRLRANLDGVPAVVLADFRGMTVEQTNDLRTKLREAEVRYEVVKNTLIRRAVAGTSMQALSEHFKGNTAVAFHTEDPTAAAKVITEFAKTNGKLKVKAGWLDGRLLDEGEVGALARLPGKDELRGSLLSVFVGAPTKFVRLLTAGPSAFARLLQARADSLE